MAFEMTFGELEALVAHLHGVASDKRIAFQGRLKTILRAGFPPELRKGRGKAAAFSAGDCLRMAVYVDLSQLGVTPERTAQLLAADDFPVFAAVKRSVDCIAADSPEPIFLYLDPRTWSPLLVGDDEARLGGSFAWAGAGHVAKSLAKAMGDFEHRRLSLLNVTALVAGLAELLPSERAEQFLLDLERWARVGTMGQPGRNIIGDWEASNGDC